MGRGVSPTPSPEKKKRTWGNIVDEMFPQYLAIGMSADEYWNGSSELAVAYRKAWDLKNQHENYLAWLNGAYIHEAIASCFSKRQDARYPDRPHEPSSRSADDSTMRRRVEEFKAFVMMKNAERH